MVNPKWPSQEAGFRFSLELYSFYMDSFLLQPLTNDRFSTLTQAWAMQSTIKTTEHFTLGGIYSKEESGDWRIFLIRWGFCLLATWTRVSFCLNRRDKVYNVRADVGSIRD